MRHDSPFWNDLDENTRKERLLLSQRGSAIAQVTGWGDWANTNERKTLVLRSRCGVAIEQVQGWGDWAYTDHRKELLLESQCAAAIEQVQGWGDWAFWADQEWCLNNVVISDTRRRALLRSRCAYAIEQVNKWGLWAYTDERKEKLLQSQCVAAISQLGHQVFWGDWANTNNRRERVLESRYRLAIKQVQGWGVWANTDSKKTQLLESQCEAAISQVTDWPIWANVTNRVERRSFIFDSRSVAAIALLNNWEKERSLFTLLLSGGHLGNFTIQYNLNNNDDDPATLRVFQIMGLIDYIAAYMDGDKNIIGESVLEKIGARTLVDRDGVTASGSGVSQGANKC